MVELVVLSQLPFIRNTSDPNDTTPLTSLRKSFIHGSRGIAIPTGTGTFRFACHLVAALRDIHKSDLPIQIFYTGDTYLLPKGRKALGSLGKDIEFVDIRTIFDDETLQLATGG